MHSSAPSPEPQPENRNEMNLADETTGILNTDQVAVIFSFLAPKDIMCARVCISWRDAAKKTIVPLTDFCVDSVDKYRAMVAMTTALPNLQQLTLCNLGWGDKYTDGQDPDEEWAAFTTDDTAHNIDIISNFSQLRSLEIENAPLNGRYPALFNIPLLQKLKITCYELKWDLEMLEGLPSLKELDCCNWSCNPHVIGNLSSLRVLRDTLVKVKIIDCLRVEGNFMALADFPHLKELNLRDTNVTGDIRDIRRHDFPALKYLYLPKSVIGGSGYKFQHIPDNQEMSELTHFSYSLFKRDHVVGGVGALGVATIRARSIGLIQSQAVIAATMQFTLRICSVLNGVCISTSTEDFINRPLKRSTVVSVEDN